MGEELEEEVLTQARIADHAADVRGEGWTSSVTILILMLGLGLLMNGLGLLGLYLTNRWDSDRDDREIIEIDCNNASRLTEIADSIEITFGLPENSITIKPCERE